MLNKFKTVIFDLDGTLIDSMWIWKEIDKIFLSERGIGIPKDLHKKIEGMSFNETAKYFKSRFDLEEDIEEIVEIWNDLARDYYKNRILLKKGVIKFLDYIKYNGISCGIATSNNRELMSIILEKYNLYDYFDNITTANDVKKGKPFPDVFIKAAENLNVNTDECLVFEDVPNGVIAAKNAGMTVVAIRDEFSINDKEELIKLADYYIDDYDYLFTVGKSFFE